MSSTTENITKQLTVSVRTLGNKGNITWNIFASFACVRIYDGKKTYA